MLSRHLAIVEPNVGGHHGSFVQHLVKYWGERKLDGRLDLIVSRKFLDVHTAVTSLVDAFPESEITIRLIETLPERTGGNPGELIRHALRQGSATKKQLMTARPTHALLMYFDHFQLSLAFGLRFGFPLHIAGIYFRPSFHYPELMNQPPSRTDALQNMRKRIQMQVALRNPHLKTLFCLDPYVIPAIRRMNKHIQAIALPDGIERYGGRVSSKSIKKKWKIDEERHIALCFGSLARRKGIFTLLEALPLIHPDVQKHLAVVFSGVVAKPDRIAFFEAVSQTRRQTSIEIVVDDRFIQDEEIRPSIEASELVLLPYLHHVGSSNVLIRAADAGIPVLGSSYGLMGMQIREYTLGFAIDTNKPGAIAEALSRHILTPESTPFDQHQAQRFGKRNNATHYAETIFSQLGYI